MSTLDVRNVALRFGDRQILDDVSFSIGAGEFTGLIGSNGVGKTTLLRAILGLQSIDAGTIVVNGETERSHRIGYVPQKISIDPETPLRARDFVALGINANRFGLRRYTSDEKARITQYLEAVGAASFADTRIGELSGGELQRILIAHALISAPSLLLLDEPLANLDPRSVQEIVALLHSVSKQFGIAVLLSAHDMNALLPVMDRIAYLTAGRCASGTTEEVVQSDVLSRLYGHHVDVLRLHGRVLVVAEPSDDVDHLPSHATLNLDE